MKLDEKLVRLRKEKGLTQLELAEAIKVSRQAVSKWEAGGAVPSTDNLKGLSDLFGVPVDFLLNDEDEKKEDVSPAIERASGRFSMDIYKNEVVAADTSFPLEIGETVSINASYSPRSASVDFGLIAPDGLFYPCRAQNGRFDKTIEVDQRGYYTLAVRNNSDFDISVWYYFTFDWNLF